jgi:hypothetical protein
MRSFGSQNTPSLNTIAVGLRGVFVRSAYESYFSHSVTGRSSGLAV